MDSDFSYKMTTEKPFDDVVSAIEENTAENQFKVLYIHDVKATLNDKGFERDPLKIIEVCNAGFASTALGKALDVAMFMPCKFVVADKGNNVEVTLVRPSMIAQMMPDAGLNDLASEVESTLKTIMEKSV